MKTIEKNIIDRLPDVAPEKSTTYEISIEDFDVTNSYLELPEELDTKMISYIEKEVRNSFEYKNYISYLKNELNLTSCSLLPGIDINKTVVSLEFHHYPLNLFEVVDSIGKEMIGNCKEGEKISCFDIAEQVIKEHYLGNIGIVPLTKTLHDMAHNRAIIVPISKVNGNYKSFIKKYKDYIETDIIDRIAEAELSSESDDTKLYNSMKLEKNISKYDVTYIKGNDDSDDGLTPEPVMEV